MLLDLDRPDQPRAVTEAPTFSVAFSPDGKSFAYVGTRRDTQRPVNSVYVRPLAGGDSMDLFAKSTAVHGVSGSIFIDRWVDNNILAYTEGMGTSALELWLVDVPRQQMLLPPSSDYVATNFTWTKDGSKVAGQRVGGPPHFWLWDRQSGSFFNPASPLPGAHQWFEAWAPDGQSVLFTAWTGSFPYADRTAGATLYRWNLADGRVEQVAENAGKAAWEGVYIVYVRFRETPELVVTRAEDGELLWSEPLGKPQDLSDGRPQWPSLPLLQGAYVAFAHSDGQWYVSPLAERAPHPLAKGGDLHLRWAPDAQHVAVIGGNPTRLRVLVNPAR